MLLTVEKQQYGYKAVDFEKYDIEDEGNKKTHNYYKHSAMACYDCIISSNYPKLEYDNNGVIKFNYNDIELERQLKKIYYTALAREKVTKYKQTDIINIF